MGHENVMGLVTRYVNYKDNDRILSIFTREKGRIDARARGCRRPKSNLLACSQPFVFGEFQLFLGKEFYTVNQCDVKETFFPLREDIDKLNAAYAMLELTQNVIVMDEPNERLYTLLYHSLSFLAYGDMHILDITLCFMVRFLNCIGFCPVFTHCGVCGQDVRKEKSLYFSDSSGGAICPICYSKKGGKSIHNITLEAMRRMLLMQDDEMAKVKLPAQIRKDMLIHLTGYIQYTLDKKIKTFSALSQIDMGK